MYIKVTLTDIVFKTTVTWETLFSNYVIYRSKSDDNERRSFHESKMYFIFKIVDCVDETIELIETYLNEYVSWNKFEVENSESISEMIREDVHSYVIFQNHTRISQLIDPENFVNSRKDIINFYMGRD